MNNDLTDLVVRELRLASDGTADCPTLIHRVAAGVARRQRRRRALAAGLGTAAVLLVAVPALGLGVAGLSSPGVSQTVAAGSANGHCGSTDGDQCGRSSSGAALALRRANPTDWPILDLAGANIGCLQRTFCRGPL